MLILIQPLFLVFFPLVPALCLRVGYSTMMTVSLAYLYSAAWVESGIYFHLKEMSEEKGALVFGGCTLETDVSFYLGWFGGGKHREFEGEAPHFVAV